VATNAVNSPVFALSRAQLTQATTCLSDLPGPARPSGPSRPATWLPALRSTLPQTISSPFYLTNLFSNLLFDLFSGLFFGLFSALFSNLSKALFSALFSNPQTALLTAFLTALSFITCAAKFHLSSTICVQPYTA